MLVLDGVANSIGTLVPPCWVALDCRIRRRCRSCGLPGEFDHSRARLAGEPAWTLCGFLGLSQFGCEAVNR